MNLDDATSPAPPSVAANDISPIRAAHLGRAGLEDGVAIETPAQPPLGSTCDTLWSRGASVPLPIASALVMSMIALCDESSDEARALTYYVRAAKKGDAYAIKNRDLILADRAEHELHQAALEAQKAAQEAHKPAK